ncbi:MAG TPA: histidine--tRNA ligase [Candidatus Dormibacteraeota bacterium]|nr:histidine--tRNA ligase [Candidatus Dormibacteraeota bacterium]
MASKAKFQAIRGTRDLLPPETALWSRVEQTAHEVFRTFGFGEIRPPIFEPTELFARAVGGETDIVSKEMYTFVVGDFARLVAWRDFVSRTRKIRDLEELDVFERSLSYLHRAASESVKQGQLPNDAGIQASLTTIQKAMAIVGTSLTERRRSNDLKNIEELDKDVEDAAIAAAMLGAVDEISLRPEATASVCRAYIEHNMQQLPQPVKLYYMGPMFRRERPQKGRYRQFYQIGAEVLGGSDAPAIDAEVIEMLMTFFDKAGLQGTTLHINSIGCHECRPKYVAALRAKLLEFRDRLGEDSKRRIETNPLRVLDSKLASEQEIIALLPKIADYLCEDCRAHYAEVKRQLEVRGVLYQENWRLVRGLDYYMRTTFEITAPGLGSQNAVCGGGRYDGLVELLGGPPTKGIGFAIGEDRLILSLQDAKSQSPVTGHQSLSVYIAWMGQNAHATAIRAAKNLRAAGISVELPPLEQKFGKALERASKLGARFALILGDNEISSGEWALKTLATGEQIKIAESDLLAHLKRDE